MHVVIINDFADFEGGASNVAISSARALADRGHSVTLFAASGPISSDLNHPSIRVHLTNQYDILHDPSRTRAIAQGIWNTKSMRELRELLTRRSAAETVIHIHTWTKALSPSVIRYAVNSGFQIVCTLHEYFSACPNGSFFNFPKSQICKLKPMSFACISSFCDRRSYLHKLWRVARHGVQLSLGKMPSGIRHFIAITEFSRKILSNYLPSTSSVYVIENPIEVSKSDPVDVSHNTAYMMVGRIDREKGAQIFAKAAAIESKSPVFIGDGDCRDQVLAINPSSTITGWLPKAEVIRRLRLSRALVFPSRWYETQGLVVREAASMGVPAIVSDSCAATEFVRNGETGIWFKSGDEKDLARKIRELDDDQLAEKIGLAAYHEYWVNPPTLPAYAKKLEDLYAHILSKPSLTD